jgi:hypothetical protein
MLRARTAVRQPIGLASARDRRSELAFCDECHRFTPLACGVFIALLVVPSFALPGNASTYAIGVWATLDMLRGNVSRCVYQCDIDAELTIHGLQVTEP